MRRFAAPAGSLLFALAVTACGAAPAVPATVPAATTPVPTSEFADINASATEMTDALGSLDEVAGIKIMTCEALDADGSGSFTGPLYVGMVTSVLMGTPIAGTVTPLTGAQRRAMVESLRNLKTPDGKFCGQFDDPGGWE